MENPYFLPPKDLLFKMLDKDMKLIVNNYGSIRGQNWRDVYRHSITKHQSPCARETALNSENEKPRCVPDSTENTARKLTHLPRNRSQGGQRRKSASVRKVNISAYRIN